MSDKFRVGTTNPRQLQCSVHHWGRRCPGDAGFVVGVKFTCCVHKVCHKGVCAWCLREDPQLIARCEDCREPTVVSEPIDLDRYLAAAS